METYIFKDSIGRLSQEVSKGIGILLEKKFKASGFDMKSGEWMILTYLYNEKNVTQTRLVEVSGRNKVAIKRLVDSLEGKKLVKRVKVAQDRRNNLVKLTTKGSKIYIELAKLASNTLSESYENINIEELNLCIKVLQEISENLKNKI